MLALLALLSSFLSEPANAGCSAFQDAIKAKMDEHTAFRERNSQTLRDLIGTETSCHKQGAELSTRIAAKADSLSCQAELDASGLNQSMKDLGTKCTDHFTKLNALQAAMREEFQGVRANLQGQVEKIKNDQLVKKYCSSEVQESEQMVEDFLALEEKILGVEARSIDGKTNYGKFTDTARNLEAATLNRGNGCAQLASMASLLSAPPAASAASPSGLRPVPNGKSPVPSSTVTGKIENDALPEGREASKVQKPASVNSSSITAANPPAEISPSEAAAKQLGFDVESSFSRKGKLLPTALEPAGSNKAGAGSGEGASVGSLIWVEPTSSQGKDLQLGEGLEIAVLSRREAGKSPEPAAISSAASRSPASEDPRWAISSVKPIPLAGEAETKPQSAALASQASLAKSLLAEGSLFLRVRSCYQRTALFRKSAP